MGIKIWKSNKMSHTSLWLGPSKPRGRATLMCNFLFYCYSFLSPWRGIPEKVSHVHTMDVSYSSSLPPSPISLKWRILARILLVSYSCIRIMAYTTAVNCCEWVPLLHTRSNGWHTAICLLATYPYYNLCHQTYTGIASQQGLIFMNFPILQKWDDVL